MKTPDSPPRFHTTVRHYHRCRSDGRDRDDPEKAPGSRRIWPWLVLLAFLVVSVAVILFTSGDF